jgi:hypothetical protein
LRRRLKLEPLGEIEDVFVFRVQLLAVNREDKGVGDIFSAVSVALGCCSVLPDKSFPEIIRPVAKSAAEQISSSKVR